MNIYDLTIKNAYIADPEKKTITWGNMGICRNKICIVTKKDISGKHEIDANKKILSPGFIDIHAHIDGDPGCGRLSLIQGVTTTIGGNCGGGMLDIGEFSAISGQKWILHKSGTIYRAFICPEGCSWTN